MSYQTETLILHTVIMLNIVICMSCQVTIRYLMDKVLATVRDLYHPLVKRVICVFSLSPRHLCIRGGEEVEVAGMGTVRTWWSGLDCEVVSL